MISSLYKKHLAEFIAIGIDSNYVDEVKIFVNDFEITNNLLLVNFDPVVFGIWGANFAISTKATIIYKMGAKEITRVTGSFNNSFENFTFFNPVDTILKGLSPIQKYVEFPKLLMQSSKSKFRFGVRGLRHMMSWYFFPRKIFIVTVKGKGYLNIFPMDLHLQNLHSNNYALALQPSNKGESHLRRIKKIVISEINASDVSKAYALGKNHGATNLDQVELSFDCQLSEEFKFPVPDFCIGYNEVRITSFKEMSTHTLFMGKIINTRNDENKVVTQPYHAHRFFYNNHLKNDLTICKLRA